MSERIPASEKTRKAIRELLTGQRPEPGEIKSDFLKSAVRLIIEEALEAEVRDALGRDYYEAGAKAGAGYRNGYRTGKLKTAEGAISYAVPQVSDREDAFSSRIREMLSGRTEELEEKAVEMYARGLSTRDIEDVFRSSDGKALLSRSAVSEMTERLWEEYQTFAGRDLSEFELLYLFVDGIAERLHLGQPREAVLVAWGFTVEGQRTLLHMAPGTKEDTASCKAFFQDMKIRGLTDPVMAITDGAAGLIRAAEDCFPRSLRQRCLAHKMRNLENKVPEAEWPQIKAQALSCYRAASPALAELLREAFVKEYEGRYPTLVSCFQDDFGACIAHLRCPINHRRAIRTTNLLERLFQEERRRTKVIPHAFGERAVLKLMYASLIRASQRWKSIKVTEFERRQLEEIKRELNQNFDRKHQPVTPRTKESDPKVSSRERT